ncbi:hypothetical protein N658DRAFT_468943 [Parathielavia hyrcaniae]|uniref:Uncharacterized protein n=1 Tax=Parathielavia hyrcaniae TaxID=113614 RepID=A0AAN6T379_9PEZI|nr:hypothetical protein N658DRAFT_468943 [Parathielavia hyrcaniae]
MAARSNTIDQADQPGVGSHAETPDPVPEPASPLSPISPVTTTTTTVTSPATAFSPLPSLALAEQTFTPLSIDTSDFFSSKKSPAALEADSLLGTSKSIENMRRNGNLSRSSSNNSTAPAASTRSALVKAKVESFEALHAATSTATLGYELLRTKSAGQRSAGLVSPPQTLSPSPSFSRSSSPAGKPTAHDAFSTSDELGAVGDKGCVATQAENDAGPQTAAAAPNPGPSAPGSNRPQAHNVPDLSPSTNCNSPPPTVVANTTLVRPSPSAIHPERRNRAVSNPIRQPIVYASSTGSPSLSHPTPDPNTLSKAGIFLGNIAALEATAERLSTTRSIEDAIREEHNELKRSESRRSSILRARAASTASETGSAYGQSQLSVASRQNSILGINSAARTGGYSPGGFIMSPHHSMSAASGRVRSSSKASSTGMPSQIPEDSAIPGSTADIDRAQEFRFLPRHGPGKASTRSVASKLSLVQIAELEDPIALTQEVLDEADRAGSRAVQDEEDAIRTSALQFIEAEFGDATPLAQPALGHGFDDESASRLQLHQPDEYAPYGTHGGDQERPATSGSETTYEQAQAAFGDFDGVHCDPDAGHFGSQPEPRRRVTPPRAHPAPAARPTTYVDPATGQQMLYYPAPVPAMLNLPPKLSKKPKAAGPIPRRAQVVSTLPPKAPRESRMWLPDPTDGLHSSTDDAPFMGDLLGREGRASLDPTPQVVGMEGRPDYLAHARLPSEASTIHPPPEQREIRRPQRLTDADNRKSRLVPADGVPPQLRASAFFELPPEAPKVEVKDGSAMDTLDSFLDASAAAPVNAFTDHVFAGKLGAEVYGPEKKKKPKNKAAAAAVSAPEEKAMKRKTLIKRDSSGNLLEPTPPDKNKRKTLVKRNSSGNLLDVNSERKRASRFSLFGAKRADGDSDDEKSDREDGGVRRSVDEDDRSGSASPSQLTPDDDDEVTEEDMEEEPVYQGPPTTLLAELQLRKQQNKMRTRPLQQAYPDGMRSTLLELDAVAEVERKARHGKRVNLAWEDPAAVPRQVEEEDEEVPLGMLYAAKATGAGNRSTTMDISALMNEVHRPLGLMERREIEENEPLSRRRDRLQGKVADHLPTSLTVLQQRMSHLPPAPGAAPGLGLRSQSRLTLPLHPAGGGSSRAGSMLSSRPGSPAGINNNAEDSDPEGEGETLAARKARLAAENPLPSARPVSGAFSAELLREFRSDEEEEGGEKTRNETANPTHARNTLRDTDTSGGGGGQEAEAAADVPEEEETLGQRRRRLQREREAREREMAFGQLTGPAGGGGGGMNGTSATIRPVTSATRGPPVGMADVLALQQQQQQRSSTMRGMGMGMGMTMDPREQERLRREAEAAGYQREMEVKMGWMRQQMPTSLTATAVGTRQAGGYLGPRFTDGVGRPVGGPVSSSGLGYRNSSAMLGAGLNTAGLMQQQQRANTLLGGGGVQGGMPMPMGMGMPMGIGVGVGAGAGPGAYGGSTPNLGVYGNGVGAAGMGGNAAAGYGMPVNGGSGPGHMDMVERWRQGVMP